MTTPLDPAAAVSPGLLTDHYELTMLSSFVTDGSVDNPTIFEAFARRLPEGRRYGVLGGLGRLLPLIEAFTFDESEIAWLLAEGVINDATAAYLADFRFRGDIDAYPEGDLYFPGSPILTVRSTLGEGVLLETLVLSVLNHDSAIASAAARMTTAAQGRPLVEMGSRRTHEDAAIAVARAAYLAGFASSSNLAAGRRHGVPTVGTAAHAFTLAHTSELEAFRSQVAAQGVGTTLLVDTYDTEQGIRNAIEVAGPELGAIRIDSGDLAEEAVKARTLLDSLGATGTRIIATSDIDEFVITALGDAPIDGYGVGTRVATGSGHPTASMVYKLVAVADSPDGPLRSVAKKSHDKISVGGHKTAYRHYDDGVLTREWYTTEEQAGSPTSQEAVPIQVPVIRGGRIVHTPDLDAVRKHCADAIASLPADARRVAAGAPYLTAELAETKGAAS
ncbi:nicotinate phosphoribosyltransferase [Nocardioides sp. GXZ039]|uniref:nicotinate phosphoribosyltransferase n=1 Tax=Nocardioides sp. GXZ039 TaxID=3136018 RepID=UPI0030F3A653